MTGHLRTLMFAGLSFGALAAIGSLGGCAKKSAPANVTGTSDASATALPPSSGNANANDEANGASGEGKLDPNDPKHGSRKMMGLDVGVYVDGKQAGVLRFGELPASVHAAAIPLEGGAKRYRVYDYLKGIGIAPEAIKSVHFHGNSDRIASVEGRELLKQKDRFVFQFISGTTGTPLQKWDTDGLVNEFVIHEIRRMTVYVEKTPPAIHKTRQCHVDEKGACMKGVPYADGNVAKGTRVYVDGKMVGFVKRRQIGDALIAGQTESGETKFSVERLIASLSDPRGVAAGIDANGIRAVELLAGDDVVGRASAEQFRNLSSDLTFTLPKHNHGKVRIHVPAELQSGSDFAKEALVSAVIVHKKTAAPTRDLVAISEDTDLNVQLAALDDGRARNGQD